MGTSLPANALMNKSSLPVFMMGSLPSLHRAGHGDSSWATQQGNDPRISPTNPGSNYPKLVHLYLKLHRQEKGIFPPHPLLIKHMSGRALHMAIPHSEMLSCSLTSRPSIRGDL